MHGIYFDNLLVSVILKFFQQRKKTFLYIFARGWGNHEGKKIISKQRENDGFDSHNAHEIVKSALQKNDIYLLLEKMKDEKKKWSTHEFCVQFNT